MSEDSPPDSVDLGVTGLSIRALASNALLDHLLKIEAANVVAVCDLSERSREIACNIVEDRTGEVPTEYADHAELVGHDGLDAVVIATPWHLHVPMAVTALRAGLDCAMEVGPANSVEECRRLVEVAERTGGKCMLLENYLFKKEAMTTCLMARGGRFGELVHARAGYSHDIRENVATGRNWRTDNPNVADEGIAPYVEHGERTGVEVGEGGGHMGLAHRKRNGDMYPTHGLGPVAKCLNVNRGNRMVALTSTASKARGMADWVDRHVAGDPTATAEWGVDLEDGHPSVDADWACGDIVNTTIRCADGATISLTYDIQLPVGVSDYSGRLRGTRGMCDWDRDVVHVEGDSVDGDSFEDYYAEYAHPLWERYERRGVEPGHGGGDFLVVKSFVEAVRRDVTPPVDVHDAAAFMAVAPLSEQSIASGSDAVPVPDFTDGAWMANDPIFGVTGDAEGVLTPGDVL